jgi:hypothetical protein
MGLSMLVTGCDGGEIGSGGDPGAVRPDTGPGAPVNHSSPEVCDSYDNNGDGAVDEGCACTTGKVEQCYPGAQAKAGVGICKRGTHRCEGDSEFGKWSACTGAVLPEVEVCGNGIDEDCDGKDLACANKPDAGSAKTFDVLLKQQTCTPGQKQACYSGPPGTAGKGPCKAGAQTCQPDGNWGPCAGEVKPKPEVCNNWVDEDCDGKDQLCPGTTAVTLNINGDCVTASCPPNAPYPVGCNVTFVGGDHRGCVANTPGSPVVYFQEGDVCSAGHLSGTLLCSSQPGGALNATNCPINKPTKYYPPTKSGCPDT